MRFFTLVFLGALFASNAGAQAGDNRKLWCEFTEPFYNLSIDLDSGQVVHSEYDWQDLDPDSEMIETVLFENSQIAMSSHNGHAQIIASSGTSKIIQAVLSYKGSNGMSDHSYPLDVVHYDPVRGPQYGGCEVGALESYDSYTVPPEITEFVDNATAAINMCFNRAVADWTMVPSDYTPNMTKFYVLYRSEVVPGEPGHVSETFSSAENGMLQESVENTKTPVCMGSTPSSLRAAMWDHCLLYGSFLQNRWNYGEDL